MIRCESDTSTDRRRGALAKFPSCFVWYESGSLSQAGGGHRLSSGDPPHKQFRTRTVALRTVEAKYEQDRAGRQAGRRAGPVHCQLAPARGKILCPQAHKSTTTVLVPSDRLVSPSHSRVDEIDGHGPPQNVESPIHPSIWRCHARKALAVRTQWTCDERLEGIKKGREPRQHSTRPTPAGHSYCLAHT